MPEIVRLWLEKDDYDYQEGVYSATRLLKPVRMIVLEEQHSDELECDISDTIAMRYGTALHDSFEMVDIPNCIQEKRFYANVGGHEISGKPDILEVIDGNHMVLWDIKSTSVWTYIYGSRRDDHIKQLSIYRLLVMQQSSGAPVGDIAKVIYIFTDWSRSRAKQGGNYPPIRIVVEDIELMSIDDTKRFIESRLKEFNKFMDKTEEELPPCTRDDLWQKDDEFALMKPGRKTAVKLFDDPNAAELHGHAEGIPKFSVEKRPGKVNRCNYCNVTKWCSQFKELEEKGIIAE